MQHHAVRHRVMYCLSLVMALGSAPLPAAAAAAPSAATAVVSEDAADALLTSPFASFFQADDYAQALEALQPLLAQYPQDPLVRRYHAMTLDRLGRSQEAITIYDALLVEQPDHAPTRYFAGQAYDALGRREQAVAAWRWVAEHSPEPVYRQWAAAAIARVGSALARAAPARKRWLLLADTGWDWDSNVTLKPDDTALAAGGDQNAGRLTVNVGLRYRAIALPTTQVDVMYTVRQSLHDDSLDEFNFTSHEIGLDGRRRVTLGGRELLLGGRYELLGGFLDSDLFSLANRWTLSAETRLTPYTRTILANRLTVSNFGPDGQNPPQTSRDGLYEALSLTHYWYTHDFRRHLFARQEYDAVWARGGNFDLRGATMRLGLHTPLLWRTEADVSSGFAYRTYPHFTSLSELDTARRRDANWDVLASLTYHLTEQVDVQLQYRWMHALNRNDFFQYDRQVAGIHVRWALAF